jgi:hypothetical protein
MSNPISRVLLSSSIFELMPSCCLGYTFHFPLSRRSSPLLLEGQYAWVQDELHHRNTRLPVPGEMQLQSPRPHAGGNRRLELGCERFWHIDTTLQERRVVVKNSLLKEFCVLCWELTFGRGEVKRKFKGEGMRRDDSCGAANFNGEDGVLSTDRGLTLRVMTDRC